MTYPAPFNMAAYVLAHSAHRPDHPALQVLGQDNLTLTYKQLEDAIRGIATGLLGLGLKPGDRVLMRLGNTPDFPMTYLACIAVGVIPIPTSSQLTMPEVMRITAETKPALIVQGPGIEVPDGDIPKLTTARLDTFKTLPPAPYDVGDPNRPAYIIYTSGTSGQPRGVVHAHRAIWARRMMWDGWYGLTQDDRLLHAGAFNWTYTLGTGLMDPWAMGATALIPAYGTTPDAIPALLAQHQATIFAAAPGVYRRLLRTEIPPLPALRHGLSAGEKLPQSLREAWQTATGTPVHEAYGMSECSTFISGSPDRPAPPDTLGYPQPGRRVQLMPETQVIAVHRDDPGLMIGYLDRPDETASKFDGDWFLTGDIGALTPEGAIAYAGRADDMMNAGGTRVSPIEVEEVLASHPAISEVAAAEVRLRTDLTLIAAFYVSDKMIDEDELKPFAAARLADYKTPRLYIHMDTLPRGQNNKLLRQELRKHWEAAHGQT